MGKRLPKLSRNITALRIICVVFSLFFIPAFQYGFVSIWAIAFGVFMALLFDRHLQNIINICEPMEDKAKRCKAVLKRYGFLTIEITIIGSLGAVILLYSGFGADHIITPLDATLMDFSPLGFLTDVNFTNDRLEFKILLAITDSVIVWFLLVFFLVRQKLKICSEFIVFGANSREYGAGDISKRMKRAGEYEQVIGLGLFFTLLPIGYVAFLYVHEGQLFELEATIFSIMGWVVISLATYINFIANVGIEKIN